MTAHADRESPEEADAQHVIAHPCAFRPGPTARQNTPPSTRPHREADRLAEWRPAGDQVTQMATVVQTRPSLVASIRAEVDCAAAQRCSLAQTSRVATAAGWRTPPDAAALVVCDRHTGHLHRWLGACRCPRRALFAASPVVHQRAWTKRRGAPLDLLHLGCDLGIGIPSRLRSRSRRRCARDPGRKRCRFCSCSRAYARSP